MGRIITVANQKGGVGKTTTVMNLGAALSRAGKRVLLVDSDPQANLTSYLGVQPRRTLDELYLAKKAPDAQAIRDFVHAVSDTLSVIPGDGALSGVEYYLFSRSEREAMLSKFLEPLRAEFDVILIDTPPSVNLMTLNALVAAEGVIIPVQPEFFSLEGIVKIRETIADVQARWNPALKILGIVVTQVNSRRKLTTEVIGALQAEFEDLVFATQIHENAAIAESAGQGTSVMEYSPGSRGAVDYEALGREVQGRLKGYDT
jgi:chromosome partitioning protein